MQMALSTSDLRDFAEQISDQLFEKEREVLVNGDLYSIQRTSRAKLKNVKIDDYVFMEQNPEKDSKYAKMAQEGHEIIWIFQDWDYVGRIVDGDVAIFHDKIKNN